MLRIQKKSRNQKDKVGKKRFQASSNTSLHRTEKEEETEDKVFHWFLQKSRILRITGGNLLFCIFCVVSLMDFDCVLIFYNIFCDVVNMLSIGCKNIVIESNPRKSTNIKEHQWERNYTHKKTTTESQISVSQ